MTAFLYYLLKMLLCSGVLLGYYWLALRNKRFHRWNRFYLLSIPLLSFVVPFLRIPVSSPAMSTVTTMETIAEQFIVFEVAAATSANTAPVVSSSMFSTAEWGVILLYLLVAVILLVGLWVSLSRVIKLKLESPLLRVQNVALYKTQSQKAPFSFFRSIFWRTDISLESNEGRQILKHELVHVHDGHTWDKLLMQLLVSVCWFNPFFWIIRRELALIHEFIADSKSVNNGDTASLAALILYNAYPVSAYQITNCFFQSPIKRRLTMLKINQNSRISYLSRLLVLPLMCFTVGFLAVKPALAKTNQVETGILQPATLLSANNVVNDKTVAQNNVANEELVQSKAVAGRMVTGGDTLKSKSYSFSYTTKSDDEPKNGEKKSSFGVVMHFDKDKNSIDTFIVNKLNDLKERGLSGEVAEINGVALQQSSDNIASFSVQKTGVGESGKSIKVIYKDGTTQEVSIKTKAEELDIASAKATLANAESNLKTLEESYNNSKARYDVGGLSTEELLKAELNYKNALAAVDNLKITEKLYALSKARYDAGQITTEEFSQSELNYKKALAAVAGNYRVNSHSLSASANDPDKLVMSMKFTGSNVMIKTGDGKNLDETSFMKEALIIINGKEASAKEFTDFVKGKADKNVMSIKVIKNEDEIKEKYGDIANGRKSVLVISTNGE